MAQPNSQMLVTRLQDIGTGFHDIAHQVSLTTNIPAMNQGDQLLQQMQQLQTQMQQMQQQNQTQMQQMQLQNQTQMQQLQTEMRTGFQGINDRIDLTNARIDSMETRNEAREQNSQARLINSSANRNNTELVPLVTITNDAVEDFPADMQTLKALRANQLTALLTEYGLDNTGSVEEKKVRFRRFIGLVAESL